MNTLEILGIMLIVQIIVEAFLIYKYRMYIRKLFRDTLVGAEPEYPNEIIPEAYPKKIYRDSLGRFAKQNT